MAERKKLWLEDVYPEIVKHLRETGLVIRGTVIQRKDKTFWFTWHVYGITHDSPNEVKMLRGEYRGESGWAGVDVTGLLFNKLPLEGPAEGTFEVAVKRWDKYWKVRDPIVFCGLNGDGISASNLSVNLACRFIWQAAVAVDACRSAGGMSDFSFFLSLIRDHFLLPNLRKIRAVLPDVI